MPFRLIGSESLISASGENGLDTTDMAVFDALVTGGAVLSLKAHFLDTLPDLSPIVHTLRYINLSFNNLTVSNQSIFLNTLDW